MSDLLSTLNPAQQEAVRHFEGPALVVAGAGSGKTRTVVHRIAYLMRERRVYPSEILAVTFTNKAAGEMKERLVRMVGPQAKELWVATFHAAAVRILRVYGEYVGLRPGFVIYDEDDQNALLKEVLKELELEAKPGPFRAMLDRIKNRGEGLSAFLKEAPDYIGGVPKEVAAEVYHRYQKALRSQGAVDFNDLLLLTIELFEGHPEVLRKVRQRARFIHVDEYQDTNPVQYRLTRLLAGEKPNLMVVGDPDQSIYGFRAADIQNILRFTQDYPEARVIRLEENYRSSRPILQVANAVIEKNALRLEKVLRPTKEGGEPVRLYRAPNAREEAAFVAREVVRLGGYQGIAVLYRTNAQSRLLEEHLRRAGVPVRLVGAVGFFERREVKDLLAYARVAVNPADGINLRRIVNTPPRGVGASTVGKLADYAQKAGVSLYEAFCSAQQVLSRPQPVLAFVELLQELMEAAFESSPVAFFEQVLEATGFREALREEPDGEERLQNVEELLRAARDWEVEEGGSLSEFLDSVALTARAEEPQGQAPAEAVTLMTLHNAKGLEFPTVFLVGLEENLLPHRNSLSRLEDLEEERRLFYVGITRAQERLYLSYAEERETYGRREYTRPSRFLEDIPRELLWEVGAFGEAPAPPSHPPAKPEKALHQGFKGGEKVRHPKFGQGTVVAAMGEEVTVMFPGVGLKRLALRFAGLERLE
ncbi:ATP-dependent DNA helicase PcrA [Meiothermus luteus]|jgi:DNA helicase-2/ATP-dependent DNA helicase PcrA|uniref:DNA 3'-5' helicase n=1 Tax=Meiothermus luteus TaxID=2026184 RepID=A0A399EP88_9DEIN|nr:UvrD-helicase domain-containing protein [Meiothermus luteus]RIH85343.1 ATP-dependent DNA helicase PcrA [Meiothermus luteus]RMH53304.1 MAG: AAA family ATPase [Deinococcota bacterium]